MGGPCRGGGSGNMSHFNPGTWAMEVLLLKLKVTDLKASVPYSGFGQSYQHLASISGP